MKRSLWSAAVAGVKLKTSNALLNLLTRTSLCICLVLSVTHFPGGYASPKGGESCQATSPIYLQLLKPSVLEDGVGCFFNADKFNASQKPSKSRLSAFLYLGMQPLDKAMLQVVPMEEITLRPEKERQEKRFEQAWNDWQSIHPCSPLPTVTLLVHSQSVRFAFYPGLSQKIRHQIENKSTVVWLDAIQVPIDTETLISILENSLENIVNWPSTCSDQSEPFTTEQGEIDYPEQEPVSLFDQSVDGVQNLLAVLQQKFQQAITRGSRNLALLLRDRVMLISLDLADMNSFSDKLAEQPVWEVPGIIQAPQTGTGSGTSSRAHGSETTHHQDKTFRTGKENGLQRAGKKRSRWPSESSEHTFDLNCPRCHFQRCRKKKPVPPERMPSRCTESPRDNKYPRLAAPSQQKLCTSLKQSCSSCQQAQDELEEGELKEGELEDGELEDGEIMDSEFDPEERISLICLIAEEGKKHPDEGKVEHWLSELRRQKPHQAEALNKRLIIAQIRREIKEIKAGNTHSDEGRLNHWLGIIEQLDTGVARTLSSDLLAVRKKLVTEVLEKMEQTLEAPPEEVRMTGWLKAIRKNGQPEADRLLARYNAVQVKRVLEHIEKTKEEHPDEEKLSNWLSIIRQHDFSLADELWARFDVVKVQRVLQHIEKTQKEHPDEEKLSNWLSIIRQHDFSLADELWARFDVVKVQRVLQHIEETQKEHPDEKRLSGWMAQIQRQDPDACSKLSFFINVARVKRVIEQKKRSSDTPEDKDQLNGWLHAIRQKNPVEADKLSSSLAMVQVKQLLWHMETTWEKPPDEQQLKNWMGFIKKENPAAHSELQLLLGKARVKRVIERKGTDTVTPEDKRKLKGWLTAVRQKDPVEADKLSSSLAVVQVEQVLEQMEAGNSSSQEGEVNSWLNDIQRVDQVEADQLQSRWFAALERSVKSVIQAVNAKGEHPGEASMDSRLKTIGTRSPAAGSDYSAQWCEVQALRVFRELEKGNVHPDESKVNGWLNDIQSVDQEKADQLKSRWFAALEKSVKSVIQAVNAKGDHSEEARMDSWLKTIGTRSPASGSDYSAQWCEARVLRVFRELEKGNVHPDESKVNGWLDEVKKQNPKRAQQLTTQWHIAWVERTIRVRVVNTRNDEKTVNFCLNQIERQDPTRAAQLSERYYVNQLWLVMEELETTNNSSNEFRVPRWLKRLNESQYLHWNTRFNVLKVKRGIQAIEAGNQPPEHGQMACWLKAILNANYALHDQWSMHYDVSRIRRTIQAIEAGNQPPEEGQVLNWLNCVYKRDPKMSRQLSLHWRIARVISALKVSGKVEIAPQKETEIQKSLLEFQGQDETRPLLACWATFQAERVILKMEAGGEHQDEDRMTEFLNSIHLQDANKAAEYYARWVAARIARMLLALETKGEPCDKTEMGDLLTKLQKHKADQADHLRERWHAALAGQIPHGDLQINHVK